MVYEYALLAVLAGTAAALWLNRHTDGEPKARRLAAQPIPVVRSRDRRPD